jgi:hypothetical protein
MLTGSVRLTCRWIVVVNLEDFTILGLIFPYPIIAKGNIVSTGRGIFT